VLARLKPWLEDASRPKLGQHIKYDTHVLANHGIAIRGYAHDTMLESYVLEAAPQAQPGRFGPAPCAPQWPELRRRGGKGAQQIPFAQVAVDKAAQYSCEDSDLTLHVHQTLWPRLQAEPRLARHLRTLRAAHLAGAAAHRAQRRADRQAPTCCSSKATSWASASWRWSIRSPRAGGPAVQPGFAQADW
jgi:DNA polymerase I-like protein with 3'-5' exonuclease and polymerase domains